MAAFAGPAWGGSPSLFAIARASDEIQAPPRVQPQPPHSSLYPSEPDALMVQSAALMPVDPGLPIVETTAVDREPTDLRVLITNGERWHLMEVGAAASWRPLPAKLSAFGQLPYVDMASPGGGAAFDASQEPASLRLKGEFGDFEAGAQYRSVGRRLERIVPSPAAFKDREGHEVWIAQRLGVLRFRLSDSELTDNVDRNPALPRTTKDQSAVTAELSLSSWPVLALTYASGDSTRTRLSAQGREGPLERHDFDSVTGWAYYYGGPRWDVTVSSTLSQSRPVLRPNDEMATTSQDLSLTLHLLDSVTAFPSLSLGQERQSWSGVRSDSSTAGLTLSYAPSASRWWGSTFASYTATRTSDGATNSRGVSLGGALNCSLGKLLSGRATLSFEAGYDRYVDAVVPDSSSRAVSGFVLLKLARF
jgi:hypothetical protein